MTDWIKTQTDNEALRHSNDFWSRHRHEADSGIFWADHIKKYQKHPEARLAIAIHNLPLPAAFREAIIAIRALIRKQKKNSENCEDALALLYWLAVVDSFRIPYSERLQIPGYNVFEIIPAYILKSLAFSYNEIGYLELSLINKTDAKWLVEQWGQPDLHTTLHNKYPGVWLEYENKYRQEQARDAAEAMARFDLEDQEARPENLLEQTERLKNLLEKK